MPCMQTCDPVSAAGLRMHYVQLIHRLIPWVLCCICSSPVPGTNTAVMCKIRRGYKPPPECLVTSLCHAFNGRSVLGQSYFQHCMLKSLLLFSAIGGELVSDPEAEVKVITCLQNCVLLPSKNDIFSILLFCWKADISFHSHFLFIHLIIMSTWNKIFKYGNKTNIYFRSDFSLLLTDS